MTMTFDEVKTKVITARLNGKIQHEDAEFILVRIEEMRKETPNGVIDEDYWAKHLQNILDIRSDGRRIDEIYKHRIEQANR